MLMMLLRFLLVVAFHEGLDPDRLWKSYRARHWTFRHMAEIWLMSLHAAAGLFAATG